MNGHDQAEQRARDIIVTARRYREACGHVYGDRTLRLLNAVSDLLDPAAVPAVIDALVPVAPAVRMQDVTNEDLRRTRSSLTVALEGTLVEQRPALVAGWLNEASNALIACLPDRSQNESTVAAALYLNRGDKPVSFPEAKKWARARSSSATRDELMRFAVEGGIAGGAAMSNPAMTREDLLAIAYSAQLRAHHAAELLSNTSMPVAGAEYLAHRFPEAINWAVTPLQPVTFRKYTSLLLSQAEVNGDRVVQLLSNPRLDRSSLELILNDDVATTDPVVRGLALRHTNTPGAVAGNFVGGVLDDDRMETSSPARLTALLACGNPGVEPLLKYTIYQRHGWTTLQYMALDAELIGAIAIEDVAKVAPTAQPQDLRVFEHLADAGRLTNFEWLAAESGTLYSRVWAASHPAGSATMAHPAIGLAASAASARLRGDELPPGAISEWRDVPGGIDPTAVFETHTDVGRSLDI